jgi:hypothetical protein
MKKLLFLLAIPALGFLASCGGDGEDEKPQPTLTFDSGVGISSTDGTVVNDSIVKFKILATSNDKDLKNISLSLSTNGGSAGVLSDTTKKTKTISWNVSHKIRGTVGDVLTFTFTATDDNGATVSKSINLTIDVPSQRLDNLRAAQKVSNIMGPDPGAYDLNTATAKVVADPLNIKDLLDKSTTAGGFTKSWGSGHGTSKFAKVDRSVFDNATTTTFLSNEWKKVSATSTATISNIAKDEYILVKTGQVGVDFDIYILKITAVVDGSGNNDYIEFTYKGL